MDGENKKIKKDKKNKNIVEITEDIENSKQQNAISTVKLTLDKEQHNTTLTCQVSHPTYSDGPKTAVIHINVEFKPELTIKHEPEEMKEGDDVKLTCSATANPPKVLFKWYIADILEYDKVKDDDLDDQISSLEISGIGKDMNGKVVKCLGSNKIQNKPVESEVLHTLNIHCNVLMIRTTPTIHNNIYQMNQSSQRSPRLCLLILEKK